MILRHRTLHAFGRRIPVSIGKGGLTNDKREGDGATPKTTLVITGILYRPDRMSQPSAYAKPIRPRDLWCDAPDHSEYNKLTKAPFAASHEVMRRADRLYDIVLLTDWNWPDAVPGIGSAIFLHRWRKPGHPTEGCIAMAPKHLRWLTGRITPGDQISVSPAPPLQPQPGTSRPMYRRLPSHVPAPQNKASS